MLRFLGHGFTLSVLALIVCLFAIVQIVGNFQDYFEYVNSQTSQVRNLP